ncbi:MAG: ribosomal protein S18-alanine N-acetyltransferase [Candidatus Bathyarchaeia archaeon]
MRSQFALRLFRPSDIDRVIYINRVCLPENYSSHFFMDLFKRFPETFIIAEEDGQVVGYIMCRMETGLPSFRTFELPKIGHIISIAVLPQYRGRGIGYSLIRRALWAMSRYKAKECYLEVRVSNTPAINLYKKLGFKIAKTIRGYYADGESSYRMTRQLPLKD